jgi:hypothetical protein
MDKQQEKEAMKRLEEMKKKFSSQDRDQQSEKVASEEQIPREVFRRNIGCGG